MTRSVRKLLEPILVEAMEQRVLPGAVVLVSEGGQLRCLEAFGLSAAPEDENFPVQTDTIYDAASVTKAAVTSCLLMSLVGEGTITLHSPVAPWLPELVGPDKAGIELRHLLGHASGLPAHLHYFDRIWAGDYGDSENARDALVAMAGAEPLSYSMGSQTVYSDLGYILLGRLIERLSGKALEQLFAERISGPLAMSDSGFADLRTHLPHPKLARIAPSQFYPDRGLLRGQVHDDNANAGGGICGHAGLFTTAKDLGKLAQTLIDTSQRRSEFFDPQVVDDFWSTKAAPETSWRMGWDTPSATPGVSHTGERWPLQSVGHLGFTGTAMWLAPKHNRFVIILSNRVYYSWEKEGIKRVRRAIFDAVTTALPPL